MKRTVLAVAMLALAGCGATSTTADIEARIVRACVTSGLFRPVVQGAVTVALPAAVLPLALVHAGIDRACADPARFAQNAEGLARVLQAFREIQR